MKRLLHKTVFGLLMAAIAIFAAGCETLQPQGITMDSLENHGGGGGGDS